MLFFACIRLLAGNEDGTKNSSDLPKTFESIKDTNLNRLLLKPFEDVPKYEDNEPFAEYLLRRLCNALTQSKKNNVVRFCDWENAETKNCR